MLPSGAIFKLKIYQNVYADPTVGKLQNSPDPYSWFSGSRFATGEGLGKRKGREKGRGIAFPHFFFYNL